MYLLSRQPKPLQPTHRVGTYQPGMQSRGDGQQTLAALQGRDTRVVSAEDVASLQDASPHQTIHPGVARARYMRPRLGPL